MKEAARLS